MRIAFAVFLFVHAAAHAVGSLTVSGLVESRDQPSDPSFLFTGLPPGHWMFKVLAVIWLIPLAAFVASGIGVIGGANWALGVMVAATVLSTALSIIWVKAAPFGLVANLIVVAAIAIPWVADRVIPPLGT
jgi:hypothetical protein